MRQYVQHGGLIRRQIGGAGIIFVILHGQAVAFAQRQTDPQRLGRAGAEGHAVLRLAAHAAHGDQLSEIGGEFLSVRLRPFNDPLPEHSNHLKRKNLITIL